MLDYKTRIRRRVSYERWTNIISYLLDHPSVDDVCRLIHSTMDDLRGYRSDQASCWSKESLDLVLADLHLNETGKDI